MCDNKKEFYMETSRNTFEDQHQESSAGGAPSITGTQPAEKMPEELALVENVTPENPSTTSERVPLTPEGKEELGKRLHSKLEGKEGWMEVDFRLDDTVNELRRLEKEGRPEDQNRIKELRAEVDALKGQKFPAVKIPRGGRGTKGNPEEIQQSIAQATQEKTPVDTAAIEKAQKQKEGLLVDLADLRVRERQAQNENASESTMALIQENLRRVQKRILEVNNVLPNVDPLEDQEKVRRVIAEYEQGGRATITPTAEATPEATLETIPPLVNEDVKLAESLTNGDGYVRGGAEAEKAIEVLLQKGDESVISPISLVEMEAATPEIAQIKPEQTVTTEEQSSLSPYESTMNRIWKENEAKREASGLKGAGENLTLEPREPELPQSEEILPPPAGIEGSHLIATKETEGLPTATEEGLMVAPLETQRIEPTLNLEEADAQMARNAEKYRATMEKLSRLDRAVEARAEKAGMVAEVRKIGEMWNKVPKRYKYMLAGGAVLSGIGAAAAGSMVAVGAVGALGTALRGLSGAGLFVTFETILKNAHEKKTGAERSKAAETRHVLLASIGAVAFAALLPKLISDYMGSEVVQTNSPEEIAFEAPIESVEKIEYIVEDGGTLWGGIEDKLGTQEAFTSMPEAQKTFVIDALKDKFAAMSPEELQAIGITSGNIDVIHPGDHIDLTGVLSDTQSELEAANFTPVSSPEVVPAVDHSAVATPTIESGAVIPQEISPTDPSIVTASEKIVKDYVDEKFGTKGIFGFGAQNGTDSINWKDSDVGFANQTVEKIMNSHPSAFPEDGARHFGIEDYTSTTQMQAGLAEVQSETGVAPLVNENAADYMKRAAATALSKSPSPII